MLRTIVERSYQGMTFKMVASQVSYYISKKVGNTCSWRFLALGNGNTSD